MEALRLGDPVRGDRVRTAQQRLADAEVQEAEALANYNIAIASFYQAVGTLLKRNGIVFETAPSDDGETVEVFPASVRP